MFPFLSEFVGHFHPVIVHLPIGILLLSAILYLLSLRQEYHSIRPAVKVSLLIGMLSAIAATLTGLLLSSVDDYDNAMVQRHQWFGIVTTIISILVYYVERKRDKKVFWIMIVMVVMLTVTGHLGGSLTHGEGYLTSAFDNYSSDNKIKPIANVQEAFVFQEVIQPILASKCSACHGKRKQKGGLRLDDINLIMKGGKNGAVIKPGDTQASELVYRILLPRYHEDHMPPKEKSPLSKTHTDILKWWVSAGAPADKRVKELEQPGDIRQTLLALQKGVDESESIGYVPLEPVKPAPANAIKTLQKRGVVVIPVSQSSNYLSASYINADTTADSLLVSLLPIKSQLIWLELNELPIIDDDLKIVGQLTAITKLQLSKTKISDHGLAHLIDLKCLQSLNLTGTSISTKGVLQLKGLPQLQTLYLFQTKIAESEYRELSLAFPLAYIDLGGYSVPTLAEDTMEVTVSKN